MMEQNELVDTINNAILEAFANYHTITIAKITAIHAKSIDCKPVTNRFVDNKSVELPVFPDVPVINLQGGGSYHAFPLAVDDYCLLFFSERCSDGWLNGQDNVKPLEYRMHDYSDGFALVGINNLAGALNIPSVIQQIGDTNQDGDYTHQGNMVQTGNLTITGNLIVNGNITINSGDLTVDGISFKNHVHDGVQVGVGNTGTPQ